MNVKGSINMQRHKKCAKISLSRLGTTTKALLQSASTKTIFCARFKIMACFKIDLVRVSIILMLAILIAAQMDAFLLTSY